MAFIPVPNTLEANVRFTLDLQQVEMVLCFDYGAADFAVAASQVEGILNLTWWAGIRSALCDSLVHRETYVVDLDSASGPVVSFSPFTNPAGAGAVNPAPNSVALCVTHRTNSRGRSFRGRTFVPAIPAGAITKSTFDGGTVADIVNGFEAMRGAAETGDTPFVIVSRRANNAPRVTGIATPVTECLARDLTVDSQRRRLPGRGR